MKILSAVLLFLLIGQNAYASCFSGSDYRNFQDGQQLGMSEANDIWLYSYGQNCDEQEYALRDIEHISRGLGFGCFAKGIRKGVQKVENKIRSKCAAKCRKNGYQRAQELVKFVCPNFGIRRTTPSKCQITEKFTCTSKLTQLIIAQCPDKLNSYEHTKYKRFCSSI